MLSAHCTLVFWFGDLRPKGLVMSETRRHSWTLTSFPYMCHQAVILPLLLNIWSPIAVSPWLYHCIFLVFTHHSLYSITDHPIGALYIPVMATCNRELPKASIYRTLGSRLSSMAPVLCVCSLFPLQHAPQEITWFATLCNWFQEAFIKVHTH